MINHAKGNLIDMAENGDFDVIVQGCNCQNTMGSGLAKEIRARYPAAYTADAMMHKLMGAKDHPIRLLGNYSVAAYQGKFGSTHNFDIINAYTQVGYLPRGIDHFEYKSFGLILRKLEYFYPSANFGFPYIGMGLAGGDEQKIKSLIGNFAYDINKHGGTVTLVEFE